MSYMNNNEMLKIFKFPMLADNWKRGDMIITYKVMKELV